MSKTQATTGGTYIARLTSIGSDVARIAEFGSLEDARKWARSAGDTADVCVISDSDESIACVMQRRAKDGTWEEWVGVAS